MALEWPNPQCDGALGPGARGESRRGHRRGHLRSRPALRLLHQGVLLPRVPGPAGSLRGPTPDVQRRGSLRVRCCLAAGLSQHTSEASGIRAVGGVLASAEPCPLTETLGLLFLIYKETLWEDPSPVGGSLCAAQA